MKRNQHQHHGEQADAEHRIHKKGGAPPAITISHAEARDIRIPVGVLPQMEYSIQLVF